MRVIQDQRTILAHWIYTREEWLAFTRWQAMKRGLLYYTFVRLWRKELPLLPEITITGQKIWTNDAAESFLDQHHKLKRVNIRDTGSMNILEITYEKLSNHTVKLKEIKIPVPKGKLREAMEVHDCLSGYTFK